MKRFLALIFYSLLAVPSYGAFGTATNWWVDGLSGSDSNGGGYDSGVGVPGTDEHATATAITVTLTGTTTGTCSPACTSTTHGPGNIIRIASGTGCTNNTNYEILSQVAGVITVDKTMGSSTNVCVGVIGGNFQTISAATAKAVGQNMVNVKDSATYSISSGITALTAGVSGGATMMHGYHTSPGDVGNCMAAIPGTGCVTIQASGTINGMINQTQGNVFIDGFVVDCNSKSTTTGVILGGQRLKLFNSQVKNCSTDGIRITTNGGVGAVNVLVTGGTSGCTAGLNIGAGNSFTGYAIFTQLNACPGMILGTGSVALQCNFCLFANNSGASSDGLQLNNNSTTTPSGVLIANSSFYGNGRDGVRITSNGAVIEDIIRNSWFWGNSGKAINDTAGGTVNGTLQFDYNAYVSGGLTGVTAGSHDVTLTVDPTTNGASNDFSLNNVAGGGAALKATGFPGIVGSSGNGYLSIGAIQPLANTSANIGGSFAYVQ